MTDVQFEQMLSLLTETRDRLPAPTNLSVDTNLSPTPSNATPTKPALRWIEDRGD